MPKGRHRLFTTHFQHHYLFDSLVTCFKKYQQIQYGPLNVSFIIPLFLLLLATPVRKTQYVQSYSLILHCFGCIDIPKSPNGNIDFPVEVQRPG